MANGYFERGEIYFTPVGVNTVPALIVSSNAINRATGRVVVVTMSAYEGDTEYSIKTFATGREGFINCDRVMCVLSRSLTKHLGTAPKEIMDQVDTALENIFDLGYEDDAKGAEIERLKSEVTRLEAQVASKDESIIARGKEIANMNAKYNKAVDRIVDLELERDVAQRMVERKAQPEVEGEAMRPVEEKKDEPPVEKKKEDFVREVVNINTATGKELREKLGVSETIAYSITGYRKKNGLFVEVSELLEVKKVTKPIFERIKDYVVISVPKIAEEPEVEKTEEPDTLVEKKKQWSRSS